MSNSTQVLSQSIKATDLVKQARFNALNSVVTDNIDTAQVKYPDGFNSCFLNLEDFEERYNSQTDRKKTYSVKLPISKIAYKQGQVRMVRPEFCVENFELFNNSVDFCESENPVVFYDENTKEFYVVKKQHTTAQVAAIANVKNEDIEIMVRVIAFSPNVSEKERSLEASKVFFKEIKGINATKDWEALPHEVALGDPLSTSLEKLYLSIPNLTWQPINYPFPSVVNPKYAITKVAQLKKLLSYAINDDEVDTLKDIIQTICNTVRWQDEKPSREISVYLIRGFYNFEKRLHPILDDGMGGVSYSFDLLEHIENYFSIFVLSKYLGSTTTDKKPWMHLIKVAAHVNDFLIREKGNPFQGSFFTYKNKKFVEAITALANPTAKITVGKEEIKSYINLYCP